MADSSIAELKSLPIRERLQVIEELWESIVDEGLDIPVPAEHLAEIDLRLEDMEKNPGDSSSWHEAKARILSHKR